MALCAIAVSQASFLNGGFETYDTNVANASGPGYWVYNAGNAGIQNWTVGGTSVDIVDTTFPVHSGSAALDLVGTPGPGSVSQSIATSASVAYNVSFWAYSSGGALNDEVYVSADGLNTQLFNVGVGSWNQYTYTFTATGSSTNILLASNVANTSNGNLFLDDVSVEVVPEPATMAVLAGIGLTLSRRLKKA